MDPDELRDTLRYAEEDIRRIVEAQRVLADVKRGLTDRVRRPLEEDLIDTEAYGDQAFGGRVIEVDGVQIIVRKLHRRDAKAADIRGADLLYEIENEKFVLVQDKKPDTHDRVEKDEDQLDVLIQSCPRPCAPLPDMVPGCGAWHAVMSGEGMYHPACAADDVFGQHKSRSSKAFSDGFTKDEFDSLFARCWIGSRISPNDVVALVWAAFDANHVLVTALQRGRF